MKKIFAAVFAMILCVSVFAGCESDRIQKINEYETKIAEFEEKNRELQSNLDELEEALDSAIIEYNKPHSSNILIQQELEELGENIKDAKGLIAEYKQEIAINKMHINHYREQIEHLTNK